MMKSSRRWIAAVCISVVSILTARPVAAVHLEKRDEQTRKEVSPEPAQGASEPCFGEATGDFDGALHGNAARLRTTVSASSTGQSEACNINAAAVVSVSAIYEIVADSGDVPGQPVALCFDADYAVAASQQGAEYESLAVSGGLTPNLDPISIQLKLTEAPIPVSILKEGPFKVVADSTMSSARDGNRFAGDFSAKIGDMVILYAGSVVAAGGKRIGQARADATTGINIRLGPCARSAPAASPHGLILLALSLAGLGAWLLRRRMHGTL